MTTLYADEKVNTEGKCFTHGSPGLIYIENIGYIGGITALIPSKKHSSNSSGNCKADMFYFLSNVYPAFEWMNKNLK